MIARVVFRPPEPDDPKGAFSIVLRRGSTEDWRSADPVLLCDEVGVDLTAHAVKIGDGRNTWTNLPYATGERALSLLVNSAPLEVR